MKVIDSGSVPLCNAEVLAHLNSLGTKIEADGRLDDLPKNLKKIFRELTTYLRMETQPISPKRDGKYTPAAIASLTAALRSAPWNLLEAEVLQILNHGPTDGDGVAMLLEDADLRFSVEQLEAIAEVVVEKLGVMPPAEAVAARVERAGEWPA